MKIKKQTNKFTVPLEEKLNVKRYVIRFMYIKYYWKKRGVYIPFMYNNKPYKVIKIFEDLK